MFGLGAPELLLVMGILILVFGAGKIGDLGGALGKSVREFRSAADDINGATKQTTKTTVEEPLS